MGPRSSFQSSRPSTLFLSAALALLAGCADTTDAPDVVVDEDVGLEEDVAVKEDISVPTFPDRFFPDVGTPDAGFADRGTPADVRADAGADARVDVPADVRPDVAADVPADVRTDAGMDGGMDAGMDVPADVRPDVPVAADVPADVRPDVIVDAGGPDAAVATWSTTAHVDHDCSTLGARFAYRCPPGGTPATIWGTDEYTHDSSICTAAVHVGRITTAAGGDVTIEMRMGRSSYTASTRNGVTSSSYGAWSCSFAIADASCSAGRTTCGGACVDLDSDPAHCGGCGRACAASETCAAGACVIPWTVTARDDHDCSNLVARYTYRCAAGGTPGSLWGTDVYTHDSSICTAAVHAGRITAATGGSVTIQMAAGRDSYVGSTRNGITSSMYGSWSCSFQFP